MPSTQWHIICVNANNGIAVVQTDRGARQVLIENLKPYLRPVSSMTEEEIRALGARVKINPAEGLDYLNANHFDYRELIPKGLALPAPDGMYN